MSINVRVAVCSALKDIGIPVFFGAAKPLLPGADRPPDKYITFSEMLNQDELKADDVAWIEGHYIALDLWSGAPTEKDMKEIRKALKTAGFDRRSENDLYEEDTKTYHRATVWCIYEEVD